MFANYQKSSKIREKQKMPKTSKMQEIRAEGAKFFGGILAKFRGFWGFGATCPPP